MKLTRIDNRYLIEQRGQTISCTKKELFKLLDTEDLINEVYNRCILGNGAYAHFFKEGNALLMASKLRKYILNRGR